MKITPANLNRFTLIKLPLVWLSGIRVTYIDQEKCFAKVKHRWINQNPFKSMFWAVQGMAAELTTGALVMSNIRASNKKISMLVVNSNATFTKKATGSIVFSCAQGLMISNAINKTIETGESQTFWMQSKGINSEGIEVSIFNFEWTIKLKE